jgi:hypothetical protein
MVLVELTVPDGIREGEEFLVEFASQSLYVACPAGCGPGDLIAVEIDVPTDDEGGAAQQLEAVEVVVPDGVYPGMEFTIDLADGRQINIVCPPECEPGVPIVVDVPAALPPPAEDPQQPGALPAEDAPAPPALTLGDGQPAQPGDRAVIDSLLSKPYLNGERARLVSWDALKGRWKVSVADGEMLSLRPQNLRSVAAPPGAESKAPPHPRGGHLHLQSASNANQMGM